KPGVGGADITAARARVRTRGGRLVRVDGVVARSRLELVPVDRDEAFGSGMDVVTERAGRDERPLVDQRPGDARRGTLPERRIGGIRGSGRRDRCGGILALTGRLGIRALQEDVRIVAAGCVLPLLTAVEAIDVTPDIVVGRAGLDVEGASPAEGQIEADTLGRGLAL